MIIAITGSNGFVGRNLVNALNVEGYEIISLDITTGTDITNQKDCLSIPRFDVMVHLAAKLFVPDSYNNPLDFYYTNILGTLNMLELARKYNARFIFASSYVYGVPQYLPIDEQHPLKAFNPYADTKIHGENLCKSYNNFYSLKIAIVRPSNIFGMGQNADFLIPSIFNQAKSGIIQLQDPMPKRDYIYIDDIVSAYMKIIHYNDMNFDIFNIGSGLSHSVKDISIINDMFGKKLVFNFTEAVRPNEVQDTVYNISRLKEVFGWAPEISFREGLEKMLHG